jgi:hypothetical protein
MTRNKKKQPAFSTFLIAIIPHHTKFTDGKLLQNIFSFFFFFSFGLTFKNKNKNKMGG